MTAEATIRRWRAEGPARFAVEALGVPAKWDQTARRGVTDQQWEASRILAKERRLSIRSGHGTGKSAFMAWAILWFMSCYFPCKIPITAPTSHQLDDVLWAELALWFRILRERIPALGSQFEWTAKHFTMIDAPRESFAVPRTSRKESPEALQGFHAENILFLIDEASGIPDEVFQVAEGALSTKGAFALMVGNPTRMSGYFYDSHHGGNWPKLHWNGEKSPLVSEQYLTQMREKYGAGSAIYKIRVLGEFAGTIDGLIPYEWIQAAVDAHIKCDIRPTGMKMGALDVADIGDDANAFAGSHGILIEALEEWSGKGGDIFATVKRAFTLCDGLKYDRFKYDADGLGAGVRGDARILNETRDRKILVEGFKGSESVLNPTSEDVKGSKNEDYFANRKAQAWWALRTRFQKTHRWVIDGEPCDKDDIIAIPSYLKHKDKLCAELSQPVFLIRPGTGKILIDKSPDGAASPNLADSLMILTSDSKRQPMRINPNILNQVASAHR